MQNKSDTFRRTLNIILILGLATFVVAVLAYLAGQRGSDRSATVVEDLQPTEVVVVPSTPVAPYTQIDPLMLADSLALGYFVFERDAGFDGLPPLGAYLLRDGSIRMTAVNEGPLPTPLPYPTSPPLPIPYSDQVILPTLVPVVRRNPNPPASNNNAASANSAPTQEIISRTNPYTVSDGVTCAPSGNPVSGVLTQRFHAYHGGIDLGVPLNTAVTATHSGQVTFAGWTDVGYGYLVTIQNGPYITYYAHNNSFNVTAGQFIGRGSVIAWSGSTGNSSGPHVHYETRIDNVPVDPLTFSSRGLGTC